MNRTLAHRTRAVLWLVLLLLPGAAAGQAFPTVSIDEIENGLLGGWCADDPLRPLLWFFPEGQLDVVTIDGTRVEHRRDVYREEPAAIVVGDGPAASRWTIVEKSPRRLVLRTEDGATVTYGRPAPPRSVDGVWVERSPADARFRILRLHGNGRVALFASTDEKSSTSIGRYVRQHHVLSLSETMPKRLEELIVLARTETDLMLRALQSGEVARYRQLGP
jgi:hypothetical protein